MSAPTATRWVYDFAEGSRDMRDLLGGKGANIAEMTRVLGAELVPAGFTITTEACVAFMRGGRARPGRARRAGRRGLARLEERAGRGSATPDDPLLVSVRSGARDSMPGMMDTILDLGLNDESVAGSRGAHRRRALRLGLLPALRADVRQRRLRRAGRALRGEIAAVKREPACGSTPTSTSTRCASSRAASARLYELPEDPREQLRLAIRAVFDSWMGERAVAYRRINHIPDDWGTAVNVQQMVFGNRGPRSGTGVAFSRDEITGAPEPSGDFLLDAQGEDVVSGVRTPRDLSELGDGCPASHAQLLRDPAHARAPLRRHAGHRVHRRATAACTCCRRAAPSAPPRPRCASPSTPSTRAC